MHRQSGELVVVGHDQICIHLHSKPESVCVEFKGACSVAPCSPHHVDSLEYELVHEHHKYTLIIAWKVSGVREINWHAIL